MEARLYELAERYRHIVSGIEELKREAGVHIFYGQENYRRKLHDEMAELAGIDREAIYDITASALEYGSVDDFYIALSDRIAKIKGERP